jgi:hypothetical protein
MDMERLKTAAPGIYQELMRQREQEEKYNAHEVGDCGFQLFKALEKIEEAEDRDRALEIVIKGLREAMGSLCRECGQVDCDCGKYELGCV